MRTILCKQLISRQTKKSNQHQEQQTATHTQNPQGKKMQTTQKAVCWKTAELREHDHNFYNTWINVEQILSGMYRTLDIAWSGIKKEEGKDVWSYGTSLPKKLLSLMRPVFLGVANHLPNNGNQHMNFSFCFFFSWKFSL